MKALHKAALIGVPFALYSAVALDELANEGIKRLLVALLSVAAAACGTTSAKPCTRCGSHSPRRLKYKEQQGRPVAALFTSRFCIILEPVLKFPITRGNPREHPHPLLK
jgi:hypothetical protein